MRLSLIALGLAGISASLAAQTDPLASRSKGSPTAPVTVYEMSDFQCPFCRRHAVENFPALEEQYVKTGKVRWIFINYPLSSIHPNAVAAAELAMCAARQNKFWPAHDILFKYQETWAPLKNPGPFLLSLIDSLKLPKGPMTTCLEKSETQLEIRSDSEGAQKAGAQSTPTFYIEGGLIVGAQPTQLFRVILDSIYAQKTRKVAAKP
ncbi:MAG: thioredoxin domain-containing protein [Gemmatimonadota bacterium]